MYEERIYRRGMGGGPELTDFEIMEEETDLWISMDSSAFYPGIEEEIKGFVVELRKELLDYIRNDPQFLTALEPWDVLRSAPAIAVEMAEAARKAGVGPMAAVAGAVAREAGREIRKRTGACRVMVENGGDIFVFGKHPITVAVFAGSSPLSDKVGIRLNLKGELGICTSSGTVGHSLSFGKADACVVVCEDVLVADAFATAFCNRIKTKDDIEQVLTEARDQPDVKGVLVIIGDALGAWGEIELVGLR